MGIIFEILFGIILGGIFILFFYRNIMFHKFLLNRNEEIYHEAMSRLYQIIHNCNNKDWNTEFDGLHSEFLSWSKKVNGEYEKMEHCSYLFDFRKWKYEDYFPNKVTDM